MPARRPLLLRALDREPLPRPPVWLMRQAGRYLPEYQATRARAGGFLQLCQTPELAAEVTLQPLRRFGMDGAILFSDILVVLEALGMELVFDEHGPHLPKPLRDERDVAALALAEPAQALGYVGETLRLVRAELSDDVALLGFCGAPFTLAAYAVEGGGSGGALAHLRTLLHRRTDLYERLMDVLAEMVARHLLFQVESGAQAVMLFDTWAGTLARADYERFVAPWTRRVVRALHGRAPVILFARDGDHLLESQAALGPQGVGLDWRTDLARAFERVGDRVALQGNLDPCVLLSTPHDVAARTRALLEEVGGRPGHVLNLGHGVLKQTDPECVAAFVRTAKEWAA